MIGDKPLQPLYKKLKKIFFWIFRLFNRFLYSILGPKRSTKLAHSRLGKIVFSIVSGQPKALQIYEGSNGVKVKLLPYEALSLGILHVGAINPLETQVVKNILDSGDICVDIGTYVDGWYTLLAAKIVGNKGHVYAFEPHPVFFQRLMENVKLNNLTNVTAENSAVASRNGRRMFYENGAGSSFFKDHAGSDAKTLRVRTTTLDSYVLKEKIKLVRLVKIDVEGAEMEVLLTQNFSGHLKMR